MRKKPSITIEEAEVSLLETGMHLQEICFMKDHSGNRNASQRDLFDERSLRKQKCISRRFV